MMKLYPHSPHVAEESSLVKLRHEVEVLSSSFLVHQHPLLLPLEKSEKLQRNL
jgi:hypothetical protein